MAPCPDFSPLGRGYREGDTPPHPQPLSALGVPVPFHLRLEHWYLASIVQNVERSLLLLAMHRLEIKSLREIKY